jgi:hypothetical protein
MRAAEKAANIKFPYLVYPRSNNKAQSKYREIELNWLNNGGNVDTFSAAVKEGVTKSPRNKTFNYLLGKFAAKRYFPKDLGLAIRAVVGAALGGDRFSFTDKDVFNPWIKQYGSGNIGNVGIGFDPATTAATTATTTGAAPWWVPILQTCATLIVTALIGALQGSGNDDFPPAQVGGGNGGGGGGKTDLMQYALPVGAAVAAYLLLFNDKK